MSKAIIYKLYFDHEPEVFYIGMTTRTINRRIGDHVYKAVKKKRKSNVYQWIREHIDSAELIIEEVCTCLNKEYSLDVEWDVIKQALSEGYTLTNKIGMQQELN